MAENRTGRMIEGVLTVNIEGDGENGISQAPPTLNETFAATLLFDFLPPPLYQSAWLWYFRRLRFESY